MSAMVQAGWGFGPSDNALCPDHMELLRILTRMDEWIGL